jgi:hypothetical protein
MMSNTRGTPTEEEIRQDRTLSEEHNRTGLELSKHRWHMCSDPTGPQYIQRVYAQAVGSSQKVISTSVNAWARALLIANPSLESRGTQDSGQGRTQSEAVETVAAAVAAGEEMAEPTQEQHDRGREQARYGNDKALLQGLVAKALGIAPTTLSRNVNWRHWLRRGQELFDEYVSEMGVQAAAERAARDVAIEKGHHDDMAAEAARQAAEEAARPTSFMEAANVLIEGNLLMERRIKGLRGDLESRLVNLDDDQRGIIESELARHKAITDRFAFVLIVSGR